VLKARFISHTGRIETRLERLFADEFKFPGAMSHASYEAPFGASYTLSAKRRAVA